MPAPTGLGTIWLEGLAGPCSRGPPWSPQFQSFSQYRCKTAKKSEEEIEFLRSNPKIWNVHSVLNVLHSLVDKSNINRQLEVYTSGGAGSVPHRKHGAWASGVAAPVWHCCTCVWGGMQTYLGNKL